MKLLQHQLIDYKMLGDACEYYKSLRYTQIEVPWIVNEMFVTMTSPTGNVGCAMGLNDGNSYLVCSAEHGFVRQAILGDIPKKKHLFSVSPCFRDEELDETHSKYFMKLELFSFGDEKWARKHEQSYIVAAFNFFNSVGAKDLKVIDTPIGFDIMSGDLEIGSYGVRNLMGNEWCAYGTGLALPRISLATGDI